jgi:hypothetical protein
VFDASEQGPGGDVEGICRVEAFTPDTRYAGGLPAAIWAKARYQCTKGDGRFIVRVRMRTPVLKDKIVAETVHRAPKSSGWSKTFTSAEVNCSAYGRGQSFYSDAEHGPHRLSPDGDAQSDQIPGCG